MPHIEGTEANFEQEVLQSPIPVIVDFWAPWCGPCKVLGPIIEELSVTYEGKIKVVKVNVDEHNSLSGRYGIMSIPTMKFFKQGNIVGEMVGAAPKNLIEAEFKKAIGA
jgi:thioredoxin 1